MSVVHQPIADGDVTDGEDEEENGQANEDHIEHNAPRRRELRQHARYDEHQHEQRADDPARQVPWPHRSIEVRPIQLGGRECVLCVHGVLHRFHLTSTVGPMRLKEPAKSRKEFVRTASRLDHTR